MKKKRVLILGAGISGLSLAWYLSSYSDQLEIVVLEKSDRIGGWMQTEKVDGFLFEKGPRTFKRSRSPLLEDLACELGLGEEIISSDDRAKRRFLWVDGQLRSFPKWPLIKALFREWRVPPQVKEEETIFDFASRRFNKEVADLLFDPMTLGIYAGDMHRLSIDSCFPFFKEWERKHGSLSKGLFYSLFNFRKKSSALYAFERGTESLVEALEAKIQGTIYRQQHVQAVRSFKDRVEVETQSKTWEADHLFCALPAEAARRLFGPHDPLFDALLDIPVERLSVVNLGYHSSQLPLKGFGYLVPTREQQEILGVVFDSEIFPQHNTHQEQTRLTVMMRHHRDSEQIAQKAVRRHLKISALPNAISVTEGSIPQYEVGHVARIATLVARMQEKMPRCTLLGNYLKGVSVNDCVTLARDLSEVYL